MKYEIRFMSRRDIKQVLEIENESYPDAATENDFLSCMEQGDCHGIVAESKRDLLGYCLFEKLKQETHIISFAVRYEARRNTIGRQMIDRLKSTAPHVGRGRISIEVPEDNLQGQQFFRSQGFAAIKIQRDYYDIDPGADAYLMQYEVRVATATPVNRIKTTTRG